MEDKPESVVLKYTIHKFSSYSASYIPDNIMVNNPGDLLSRWFTDSSTQSQFIMLKLESPSIVETIKFGKFIKAHVSNLKKFKVLGGTEENNLSHLLSAGLKNDSTPEVFRLRHKTQDGLYLPVKYIKIVPQQSWGPAYNYTIWFVELSGKNQNEIISDALETINMRKEEEAVRLILKHLRRHRYKDAFEALTRESGVQLEGPIQARLWNALVENGDYKLAEKIFEEAAAEGELDWFVSWQPHTPLWRQMSAGGGEPARAPSPAPRAAPPVPRDLHSDDRDLEGAESVETDYTDEACGCCGAPGPRGGHQLLLDSTTGTLYLFGGWNGTEDLDDLWAYSTVEERWTLLCRHSGAAGGPSPRSCHKMVFDPVYKKLYTLGRYLDNAQRIPANMNSELYSYDVTNNTWSLICYDTAAVGGPRLVFDHQMCIDVDTHTIYVFGGRVLPSNTEEVASPPQYSGLYAYYIATDTWQPLQPDKLGAGPQPRVSHSMLFHPGSRRLYILAGQRNKEHLVDLWWWEAGSGRSGAVCAAGPAPPPPAGFTQRATLDPDTDEMFVLSGMSKEKDKRVYNTLWVFSLRRLTWTCVYRNESVRPDEPRPRFAHQLVYDPVKKIHYLFGGNPGNHSSPRLRLDDLWSLRLMRPTVESVLSSARCLIRETCYRELCATPKNQLAALDYLRTELNDVMDHSCSHQVSMFQKLATVLFSGEEEEEEESLLPAALSPRRVRALAARRARAGEPAPADLARALAVVLGAEESVVEASPPHEAVPEPAPDTWEVGRDARAGGRRRPARRRLRLYDALAAFCRPSAAPPAADLLHRVTL